MKNLILSITFSLCLIGTVAATEVRIVDGKVKFPISTVNGIPAFNTAEQNALIAVFTVTSATDGASAVVVPVVPLGWEVNLSTCIPFFESKGDWEACQTRAGLRAKAQQIRNWIDSLSDFGVGDAVAIDFKQRAAWVKSYYLSLP